MNGSGMSHGHVRLAKKDQRFKGIVSEIPHGHAEEFIPSAHLMLHGLFEDFLFWI